jgi:hypothetical protein
MGPHKKQSTSNKPAGRIDPTRGLIILVARLTARNHNRIFLLCYDFANNQTAMGKGIFPPRTKRNGRACSAQVQVYSRGIMLKGSAFILQAAFADINIHKSRSVYYWQAQNTHGRYEAILPGVAAGGTPN